MTTAPAAPALSAAPTPPSGRPWYRRRAFLTSVGVAVVLAATVVTDLPTSSTKADDLKTSQEIVSEVVADAAPCNLGMTEAFTFYADVTTSHITAANRAQIPALIRDDLSACSFTDQSIVDLASIDVPGNAAGRALNTVAQNVLTWCDPAALTAIGQITDLIEKKSTVAGRARLAADERALTTDRSAVYRSVAALEHRLRSTDLKHIPLVKAP